MGCSHIRELMIALDKYANNQISKKQLISIWSNSKDELIDLLTLYEVETELKEEENNHASKQ